MTDSGQPIDTGQPPPVHDTGAEAGAALASALSAALGALQPFHTIRIHALPTNYRPVLTRAAQALSAQAAALLASGEEV